MFNLPSSTINHLILLRKFDVPSWPTDDNYFFVVTKVTKFFMRAGYFWDELAEQNNLLFIQRQNIHENT